MTTQEPAITRQNRDEVGRVLLLFEVREPSKVSEARVIILNDEN